MRHVARSSSACLSRRSKSFLGRAETGPQHGREGGAELGLRLLRGEGGRIGQAPQELGLREQHLAHELAARAEPHQVGEEPGLLREELEPRRPRTRRRDEALELVQRLVGIRSARARRGAPGTSARGLDARTG